MEKTTVYKTVNENFSFLNEQWLKTIETSTSSTEFSVYDIATAVKRNLLQKNIKLYILGFLLAAESTPIFTKIDKPVYCPACESDSPKLQTLQTIR